jgi:hypothetical protein
MLEGTCRHCNVDLVFTATKLSGDMWRSKERYDLRRPFSQFCWIGERHTSRLHELNDSPQGERSNMYTKRFDEADADWEILDLDGDYICSVSSKESADALLSHLNRG